MTASRVLAFDRGARRTTRRTIVGLVLLLAPAHLLSAQAHVDASTPAPHARIDALRLGDVFPHLAGPALSGRSIEIPDSTSSRSTVVVFSFSKAAGDDAGRWNEGLAADTARHHIDVILVAELESAPRLMRGLIRMGIRRGVAPSVRDQMLVLDRDEALWKRRLVVSETSHSYVVLVAPDGRVRWLSDGAFDEARLARLHTELLSLR